MPERDVTVVGARVPAVIQLDRSTRMVETFGLVGAENGPDQDSHR